MRFALIALWKSIFAYFACRLLECSRRDGVLRSNERLSQSGGQSVIPQPCGGAWLAAVVMGETAFGIIITIAFVISIKTGKATTLFLMRPYDHPPLGCG